MASLLECLGHAVLMLPFRCLVRLRYKHHLKVYEHELCKFLFIANPNVFPSDLIIFLL